MFHLDNFTEFEYVNSKCCFVFYCKKGENEVLKIRLDSLLTRQLFPYVFHEFGYDDTDSENDEHAISQDAINNESYLKRIREMNNFLYSFESKLCTTCNEKWFVTKMPIPGNVKLDILDPNKNKSLFQLDDTQGTECEGVKKILVYQKCIQLKTIWTLALCLRK